MIAKTEIQNWVLHWLREEALPLWLHQGFSKDLGFAEGLSSDPLSGHFEKQRSMVQARSLYVLSEAKKSLWADGVIIDEIGRRGTKLWFENFLDKNHGGFFFSKESHRKDLYGQAFALFALAHIYEQEWAKKELVLQVGQGILAYLSRELALPQGGFAEISNGEKSQESNPLMHLLEACLSWIALEMPPSPWRSRVVKLAEDLVALALEKMMSGGQRPLAERFFGDWQPKLEDKTDYFYEPGHQFEWAWLLFEYRRLCEKGFLRSHTLLNRGMSTLNEFGEKGLVGVYICDEMNSRGEVTKSSSRFWPQTERLRWLWVNQNSDKISESFLAVKSYLTEGVWPGLWKDQRTPDGEFTFGSATGGPTLVQSRASSLYHFVSCFRAVSS